MVLIYGGAYQGKREYARARFPSAWIYECAADDPSFPAASGAAVICGFEQWVRALVRAGRAVQPEVEAFLDAAGDCVILCTDISCGLVPADPELRAWREETGRAVAAAALRADEVIRIFCGIPTKLK